MLADLAAHVGSGADDLEPVAREALARARVAVPS
jgi:hypothetical protein